MRACVCGYLFRNLALVPCQELFYFPVKVLPVADAVVPVGVNEGFHGAVVRLHGRGEQPHRVQEMHIVVPRAADDERGRGQSAEKGNVHVGRVGILLLPTWQKKLNVVLLIFSW
jgi:hypothetical protein